MPIDARLPQLRPVPQLRGRGRPATVSIPEAEGGYRYLPEHRDAVQRRTLAIADVLAAAGAVVLAVAVLPQAAQDRIDLTTLVAVPLIVVMSKLAGLYDREELLLRKSSLEEVPALLQVATLYALIIWIMVALGLGDRGSPVHYLALCLALFLMLAVFRTAARALARWLTPPERVLLLGDASACGWVRTTFERRRHLHAVLVAGVPEAGIDPESPQGVHGQQDLDALASSLAIDRIIITPDRAEREDVLNLIHSARSLGIKVSVLPRVLEVLGSSVEFDELGGLPVLSVHGIGLTRSSKVMKRAFDIVGSLFALLFLLPLMLLIALAIKLDSPGPIFFRQRRIGRDGEPFDMLKFRTMVRDADQQKEGLRHLNEADGLFKIAADPRITHAGRLLRRPSLDELPQLVNVLRGKMSLVGPRPLIIDEDERIQGWHRRRLQLTPGMTGHWQILGSARIPLEQMSRIDYLYATNWSLWLDIKIVLRTIPYVLTGQGQ